jgi:hypothetical protein
MNLFYKYKLNNFDTRTQFQKVPDLQFHGSEVLASKFIGNFTREGIIKKVEQVNKRSYDTLHLQGRIGVAVHYKDNGWFGGVMTDIGQPMNVFDPTDSNYSGVLSTDRINAFQIYLIKKQ